MDPAVTVASLQLLAASAPASGNHLLHAAELWVGGAESLGPSWGLDCSPHEPTLADSDQPVKDPQSQQNTKAHKKRQFK